MSWVLKMIDKVFGRKAFPMSEMEQFDLWRNDLYPTPKRLHELTSKEFNRVIKSMKEDEVPEILPAYKFNKINRERADDEFLRTVAKNVLDVEFEWSLFQNQADIGIEHDMLDDPLVSAARHFVVVYGFDIDSLPPNLYKRVSEEIKKDVIDSYGSDMAEEKQ